VIAVNGMMIFMQGMNHPHEEPHRKEVAKNLSFATGLRMISVDASADYTCG